MVTGMDALELLGVLAGEVGEPSAFAASSSLTAGRIVAFMEGLRPLITLPDHPGAPTVVARTTVSLGPDDVGRDVVVWTGPSLGPVVLGKLLDAVEARESAVTPVTVESDGDRIVLVADKTISLRCGKASITLSGDGSVIIEGARVTSRSIGINRVMGAAVHIN